MSQHIKHSIDEHIICAGYGGQGIVVMATLCATAAMFDGYEVSFIPSYGAEVRGGSAYGMIRISSSKIGAPFFSSANSALIMNQIAMDRFISHIHRGGTVVINTSMVTAPQNNIKKLNIFSIPATELAKKLGNPKTANVICLGRYAAIHNTISEHAWHEALISFFTPRSKELADLCIQAFETGKHWNKH